MWESGRGKCLLLSVSGVEGRRSRSERANTNLPFTLQSSSSILGASETEPEMLADVASYKRIKAFGAFTDPDELRWRQSRQHESIATFQQVGRAPPLVPPSGRGPTCSTGSRSTRSLQSR